MKINNIETIKSLIDIENGQMQLRKPQDRASDGNNLRIFNGMSGYSQ